MAVHALGAVVSSKVESSFKAAASFLLRKLINFFVVISVQYIPMFMPVDNFAQAELALQKATLQAHLQTDSAIVSYYESCGEGAEPLFCFFNATYYGFPDPLYSQVLKNATIYFGNESAIIQCNHTVVIPFMDNAALYIGFSSDVLKALK